METSTFIIDNNQYNMKTKQILSKFVKFQKASQRVKEKNTVKTLTKLLYENNFSANESKSTPAVVTSTSLLHHHLFQLNCPSLI